MSKHERVAALIELLLHRKCFAAERGLTKPEMARALGWNLRRVRDTIQPVRDSLERDDFGLACQPMARNGPWVYFLTGSEERMAWWAANRVKDGERRIKTVRRTMQPIVKMTDGRTIEGQKARKIVRILRFLEEELAGIE